jgi:hypothetical protein
MEIRLDALLVVSAFGPPSFYFVLFILYYMQGRFARYVPTVSETGTEHPNAHIMAIGFSSISACIFFGGLSVYLHLCSFYKFNGAIRWLYVLSILAGSGGFIALSNFPVNVNRSPHFLSSFIGLGGIITAQLFALFVARGSATRARNAWRMATVAIQAAALLYCGFTEHYTSPRMMVTSSAFGEYLFLAFLPLFFFSLMKEMAQAVPVMVIID